MRGLVAVSVLLAATVAAAAEKKPTGTICIAPFHAQQAPGEPNMSLTTWAPSSSSRFEFRIGKDSKHSAAEGEMVTIANVPADRKWLIGVRLDGRPFESFWIDLRREPRRRACFWLYPGYWHWINTGWEEGKGCRCK